MKLKQHPEYKNMYYLQWPDGSLSTDFYNKTMAKEHLRRPDIENYTPGVTYNDPLARGNGGYSDLNEK